MSPGKVTRTGHGTAAEQFFRERVRGARDTPDGQWRPLKLIVICKQPDVFCIALAPQRLVGRKRLFVGFPTQKITMFINRRFRI